MSVHFAKSGAAAASIALLIFGLVGCAGESPAGENQPSDGDSQQAGDPKGGDGDYAFGTDRGDMVTAIEQAFSSDNATARWEGDRLVLALDGDSSATMAGFTQCRVLLNLLLETDNSSIEFPNGSVACEEVLAD